METLNKRKKSIVILLFINKSFFKYSFRRNSLTYRTSCHAIGHFIFWCHHITYRMLYHASDYLVIYHACYGFERVFFPLKRFFTLHSFHLFSRLPWGKVSRASCWSSKYSPGPTSCLNHSNSQKRYTGRFYLRVRTDQLRNIKIHEEYLSPGSNSFQRHVSMLKASYFIHLVTEPYSLWWTKALVSSAIWVLEVLSCSVMVINSSIHDLVFVCLWF